MPPAVAVVVVVVLALAELLESLFPVPELVLLLLTDFPLELSFDVALRLVYVCHFQPPHMRRRTTQNNRFDQPIDSENVSGNG